MLAPTWPRARGSGCKGVSRKAGASLAVQGGHILVSDHGTVSPWACAGTSGPFHFLGPVSLAPVPHVCVGTRESRSLLTAASCLCVCTCVSVHTCVFAHTHLPLCLSCEAVSKPACVCACVLGSLETDNGFALPFEGIFFLLLSFQSDRYAAPVQSPQRPHTGGLCVDRVKCGLRKIHHSLFRLRCV